MTYLYLLVAIVAEVIATSFLKQSSGFTRLAPSVVTIAGYAIAFFFLSLTLRSMNVGVAYAIWSGLGIVLITAIAWMFYGEKIDAAAMAGMGLIIAGVIVMNLFSKTISH